MDDYDTPRDYVRADHGSSAAAGGSVYQPGVSERTLVVAVVLPFVLAGAVGFYAIVRANHAVDVAAEASTAAARATDRAMLAERESRLAQEDLTLLRAKVAAAGIAVESAGDHE